MTAPMPIPAPEPPTTTHPRSATPAVGGSATGTAHAAEVELLVEEIRHLRARLESLETVLTHAVIPTVARVAAVPGPDAETRRAVPAPPADLTVASRARLNRRPRLFPLPDGRPSRPRPPLPG